MRMRRPLLKTTPTLFTRIVREAYTPDPAEFVSGAVKSNNIGLLMTFQKVFQLDRPSAVFAPARQTLDRELGG